MPLNDKRPAMLNRSLAAALILALPLAGCGKKAANGGAASGEILPGSASDAMLPEDRVTSQPPLDPRGVRSGAPAGAEAEASAAPEASAVAAEPAATKAAE